MTTPSPTHKHEASKEQGILSDEIVEKAADAGLTFVEEWKPYKLAKFKKEKPHDYAELKAVFGAALKAVLPNLIEECVKMVTKQVPAYYSRDMRDPIPAEIIANIRSLIPKDSSNG